MRRKTNSNNNADDPLMIMPLIQLRYENADKKKLRENEISQVRMPRISMKSNDDTTNNNAKNERKHNNDKQQHNAKQNNETRPTTRRIINTPAVDSISKQ